MPQLQLSPEDLAKVARLKSRHEKLKIDPEWQFVGEFGYYFGWQGVEAIMDNKIDLETAIKLLRATKKVWSSKVIDMANATYVGTVASTTKKGGQIMKKGLKDYLKDTRIDT